MSPDAVAPSALWRMVIATALTAPPISALSRTLALRSRMCQPHRQTPGMGGRFAASLGPKGLGPPDRSWPPPEERA